MMKKAKNFNLAIVGVGGQGLLTLLKILDEAALIEGKDFKSAEVHGLSQRGGSVEVYFRMGEEIYSPLICQGGADLIISLEAQQVLQSLKLASKKTTFLINDFFIPILGRETPKIEKISEILRKFSEKIILIKASEICKKNFKTEVTAGIFLLGYGISKNLIPLKEASILKAIKKVILQKYLELNLKAFNLAKSF